MLLLAIGLVVFLGIHLVPTSPDLRNGLAERFGQNAYKIAFSVISLVGFALIVIGYHKLQMNPGKNILPFGEATPPEWLRHVTYLLMLPAMILLVAAYVPSRIRTAVKHPMLAAIKLWALAHLLVNWDLASLLLFGGFLGYAVYDRISVKRRGALGPLGAKSGGAINDVLVVGLGTLLFVGMMFYGHPLLIGVPVGNFSVAP